MYGLEALVASSLAIKPFTLNGAHDHDDSALHLSSHEHMIMKPSVSLICQAILNLTCTCTHRVLRVPFSS